MQAKQGSLTELAQHGKCDAQKRALDPPLPKSSKRLAKFKEWRSLIPVQGFIATQEFSVYSPGSQDVPWDPTNVLVPGSLVVLPDKALGCQVSLRELVFEEGVGTIGKEALQSCRALNRVHFPSSLVRICNSAFRFCVCLEGLNFSEGHIEICEEAFAHCDSLSHVLSSSSTVMSIGSHAFFRCSSLAKVQTSATHVCHHAFESCRSLQTARLLGRVQLLEAGAFDDCNLLSHVTVPPVCMVVDNVFNFSVVTSGTVPPDSQRDRVVMASECLQGMTPCRRLRFELEVRDVLEGAGLFDHGWRDKHEELLGVLDAFERRRKRDVTSHLELAIWAAEMSHRGPEGWQDKAECRVASRAECVIPHVMPFLWPPEDSLRAHPPTPHAEAQPMLKAGHTHSLPPSSGDQTNAWRVNREGEAKELTGRIEALKKKRDEKFDDYAFFLQFSKYTDWVSESKADFPRRETPRASSAHA